MNQTDPGHSGPSRLTRIDPTALAAASAVVSATTMLLLGLLGAVGLYEGAVRMMEAWHLFFGPSVLGIIGGMLEGAIIAYVLVWFTAWLYNIFIGE